MSTPPGIPLAALRPALLLVAVLLLVRPLPLAAQPLDLEATYQAAKADLTEGRGERALTRLRAGLAQGIADRELRWSYLAGVAVAYDALRRPLETLEAIHRFASEVGRAGLGDEPGPDPAWVERRAGMLARAAEIEAIMLRTHGALDVQSTPEGARISVDGWPAGAEGARIAPSRLYLKPGAHVVRLERADHRPSETLTTISLGQIATVHATLVPIEREGTLVVISPDEQTQVSIDGAPRGSGRLLTLTLLAGSHRVRVEHADYEPLEQSVRVVAGKTRTLQVSWPVTHAEGDGALLAVETSGSPAKIAPLTGWITVGAGAAVLLAGIPFTAMAYDNLSDLDKLVLAVKRPDQAYP